MVCNVTKTTKEQLRSKTMKAKKAKASKKNKTEATMLKEKKRALIEQEFVSLRALLPESQPTSPLDVVLSAIQYIQKLQNQLAHIDPEVIKNNFVNSGFYEN